MHIEAMHMFAFPFLVLLIRKSAVFRKIIRFFREPKTNRYEDETCIALADGGAHRHGFCSGAGAKL